MAEINGLQNELTRFHMSLPPELFLGDQSVARYMASTERPGYVFLHMHLAMSHIDLYRFSLPGQHTKVPADLLRKLPPEFLARSQKQAVAHAMSLGRFCDAIQNEVDGMRHTGKLELAGDYSTFQMSTQAVRVLLIALQYKLYRDINDVATAPLWRSVEVDEPHIHFLVDSIQRVTRPWCDILMVARQAVCQDSFCKPDDSLRGTNRSPISCAKYDHNALIVAEFNKTRKLNDSEVSECMGKSQVAISTHSAAESDALLESIACSRAEQGQGVFPVRSPADSTRWMPASLPPPSPGMNAAQTMPHPNYEATRNAPGIPLFLAHARSRSGHGDVVEAPVLYDADSAVVSTGDLSSVLPASRPTVTGEVVPVATRGGRDPLLFQQSLPQPHPGFQRAQQSICGSMRGAFAHDYNFESRQQGQTVFAQHHGEFEQ